MKSTERHVYTSVCDSCRTLKERVLDNPKDVDLNEEHTRKVAVYELKGFITVTKKIEVSKAARI